MWEHQADAVRIFLNSKHGILEMATGTGKTMTAICIMRQLFMQNEIRQSVIVTYGNDLLEQWYKEILLRLPDVNVYRWFGSYNEFARFQLCSNQKKILLLSRIGERVRGVFDKLEAGADTEAVRNETFVLFDEVHGAGSRDFRDRMTGILPKYRYCLGLSATPIREFDDTGNQFLKDNIGPVIYTFGIEDAIKRGILCEFRYIPLSYSLTADEKHKKKKIIAAYEAMKKQGKDFQEEDMYRELARINKLAVNKIPEFESFISLHSEILENCIIFVETKEYGLEVQKVLLENFYSFHTYYGEDGYQNLIRFAKGQIQCLITCKKISEGIDIKAVRNIVMFSADRGHLVTTQRIGRSLRRNPEEPGKKACVVDFVLEGKNAEWDDITADAERSVWLKKLSEIRRTEK